MQAATQAESLLPGVRPPVLEASKDSMDDKNIQYILDRNSPARLDWLK